MALNFSLMKRLLVVMCLMLVVCMTTSCKDPEEEAELTSGLTTTDEEEVEKPDLPPASSLAVDFTDFGGGTSNNIVGSNRQILPDYYATPVLGSYFADAAVVVLVWNSIIVTGMGPPIALFTTAASKTAFYQGDRTWIWYVGGIPHGFDLKLNFWSARLTGTVSEDATTVSWKMEVSSQTKYDNGCCTDFQWFTGQHNIGGTGGSWQFYDPQTPDVAHKKILVAWDVTSDTIKSLTFTDNSSKDATSDWGNGSYLQYTINGNAVNFTAKDSSKANATIITWDTSTDTGRIQYDDATSDGCWDSSHNDTACSP